MTACLKVLLLKNSLRGDGQHTAADGIGRGQTNAKRVDGKPKIAKQTVGRHYGSSIKISIS